MSYEEDVSSSLAPASEVSKIVLSCLVAGLFIAVIAGVIYFGGDGEQVSTASGASTTDANQTNVLGSVKEAKEVSTVDAVSSVSTAAATTVTEKQTTATTTATTTSLAVTATVVATTTATTAAPTTTVAAATTTSKPAVDDGPSAEAWSKLRDCEASGNYQISSRNGLYHGAYQFDQNTWDGTAKSAGRTDLVGVLPANVDPVDQDAMALELYRSRGASPWPTCGRHLE